MDSIDIALVKKDKSLIGKKIKISGWIRGKRDSKNTSFFEVNDGTAFSHLQIVVDKSKNIELAKITLGCSVEVVGQLVKAINNDNDVELNADEIFLIGECPLEYPLQKKRHTFEFLRTIPHLRIRSNTFNAIFRLRSCVSYAIYEFFEKNGFLLVHTPIITGSDCEGGGDIFQVTTIGFSKDYKNDKEYHEADFFKQKAGLTVSGQLEAEVMASAFKRVYTFGPSFRAENSNTSRHAAEFWQVEPEIAFANLRDAIVLAGKLIKHIIETALKKCSEELEFFDARIEKGLIIKLQNVINNDFEILDYTKAIDILKDSKKQFEYPIKWGLDLQSEHERYLCEDIFKKPLFIIDYPKEIKSFYMKQNPDRKTVAAADLLVPSIGEIIGCSERENDYDKLLAVIKERNMNIKDYEQYLDLRIFGSVPHSGFGLGLERMLMYMSGISNIRDTQIFPRAKDELR